MGSYDNAKRSVIFTSDWHLGNRVSRAGSAKHDLQAAIETADNVVLLGDNIEGFFTHGVSIKDSILQGIAALVTHVVSNPDTRFHYVTGNHEEVDLLFELLTRLQNGQLRTEDDRIMLGDMDITPYFVNSKAVLPKVESYQGGNFEWDPIAIGLGEGFITHGHHFIKPGFIEPKIKTLETAAWWKVLTPIVDRVQGLGQLLLPHRNKDPRLVAEGVHRNITEWIASGKAECTIDGKRTKIGSFDDYRAIFFGHTHNWLSGHSIDTVKMYNSGSMTATPHTGFSGFRAELDVETGAFSNIEPLIHKQRGLIPSKHKFATFKPDGEWLVDASDLHIGAEVSTFEQYKKIIHKAMDKADRVVLNGDIFELFYLLSDEQRKQGATAIGIGTELGLRTAAAFFGINPRHKDGEKLVIEAMDKAIDWLEGLATANPNRQIHFVLGNHENIRGSDSDYRLLPKEGEVNTSGFRERLNLLQQKHANFQWDPEMIIIGNQIYVHGDLQLNRKTEGKTDATRPTETIEDAGQHNRDTRAMNYAEVPGNAVREKYHSTEKAALKIYTQLEKRAGYGSEYVALLEQDRLDAEQYKRFKELEGKIQFYNGGQIFTLKEFNAAEHIFSGHTHTPYENLKIRDKNEILIEGKTFHNSGGSTTGAQERGHGVSIMAAKLDPEGKIIEGSVISHESYQRNTNLIASGFAPQPDGARGR